MASFLNPYWSSAREMRIHIEAPARLIYSRACIVFRNSLLIHLHSISSNQLSSHQINSNLSYLNFSYLNFSYLNFSYLNFSYLNFSYLYHTAILLKQTQLYTKSDFCKPLTTLTCHHQSNASLPPPGSLTTTQTLSLRWPLTLARCMTTPKRRWRLQSGHRGVGAQETAQSTPQLASSTKRAP